MASKFQQRHYEELAKVIHAARRDMKHPFVWDFLISRLGDALQDDNPHFDRAKFINASK